MGLRAHLPLGFAPSSLQAHGPWWGGDPAHLGAGPFPLLAHACLWVWWPHLVDPRTPPVVPVHYQ